jgi:hypothetical protein
MKRLPFLLFPAVLWACGDQVSGPQTPEFSPFPSASLNQTIVCGAPAPEILSWWSGDDNALDPIGSHHASLEFGASYAPGIAGSAFSLDGQDDMVAIGANGYPESDEFTIAAWVWIDGTAPQPISSYWTVYADDGHGFWIYDEPPSGGGFRLIWWQSGNQFVGNTAIPAGEWHHIALTHSVDGTDKTLTGYVDGAFDGENRFDYPGALLPGWYGGLGIGRHGAGSPEPFKGLIDEVQVYGRALSEAEIELLACATPMAQVEAMEAAVAGLVLSGSLDEGNANALLASLNNVSKSIVKEKPNIPNLLDAFVNKVQGFINGGILTQDEGRPLIDAAQALKERLA